MRQRWPRVCLSPEWEYIVGAMLAGKVPARGHFPICSNRGILHFLSLRRAHHGSNPVMNKVASFRPQTSKAASPALNADFAGGA